MKKLNLKKILYSIIGKEYIEEAPPYPSDFAIIDFSPVALRTNIRDDQNKIVYRYKKDEIGNLSRKKYSYSNAVVIALRDVARIPIFDKTRKEIRFPVFQRILPGEVVYHI